MLRIRTSYWFLLLAAVPSGSLSTVAESSSLSEASFSSSGTLKVVGARAVPADDGADLDLDDSVYSSADTGGSTWKTQFEEEKARKAAAIQHQKEEEQRLEEETKMLDIYEKESRVRDRALHMLASQKRAAEQVYAKQRLGEQPENLIARGQKQLPRALVRRHSDEQNQWWGGTPSYFTSFQQKRGDGDGDDVPDSTSGQNLEDIFQDEANSGSRQAEDRGATNSDEDAELSGDADHNQEHRVEQGSADDVNDAYNGESKASAEESHGNDDLSQSRSYGSSEVNDGDTDVASTREQTNNDNGDQLDGNADVGQSAGTVEGSEANDPDSTESTHDRSDMAQHQAGDADNLPNDVQSENEPGESNDHPSFSKPSPPSGGIAHTYSY